MTCVMIISLKNNGLDYTLYTVGDMYMHVVDEFAYGQEFAFIN